MVAILMVIVAAALFAGILIAAGMAIRKMDDFLEDKEEINDQR